MRTAVAFLLAEEGTGEGPVLIPYFVSRTADFHCVGGEADFEPFYAG